jgi:hypothetical protein
MRDDDGLGIVEFASDLLVYPNPTNAFVNIVCTSEVKEIVIYNLSRIPEK